MLSEKQLRILTMPLPKMTFIVGVTGSGKSMATNMRVYREICTMREGSSALFTGNTSESLYKNVIKDMCEMDSAGWLSYTRSPAMIRTANGCEIFCVGVNNEGADKRLQGGSVDLWYGDEPTTYPRSAFDMCLSRCRGQSSTGELETKPAIFTLNPDDDLHYIKREFIDRRDTLGIEYIVFDFADNPAATPEFVDEMRKRFAGVFYDRMILGKWSSNSEYKVVPEFTEELEREIVREWKRPEYYNWMGAIDPAFNDFSAYLLGYYDFRAAKYIIEGEYVARRANTSEIAQGIRAIEKQLYGDQRPQRRVSDTALQVIADLYQLHNIEFIPTRKDDKMAQINNLRVLMQQGKVIIHPRCKTFITHLRSARWNKNKTSYERTETEGHYDTIDAAVYFVRNCDTTTNPYPLLDKNIKFDDTYIPMELLKKENKNASSLATIFRR